MKTYVKITIVVVVLVVIGLLVNKFYINKPHLDPSDVKDKVSVLAPDLFKLFNEDEAKAKTMYLSSTEAPKDIHVEGVIKEITVNEDAEKISRYSIMMETGDSTGGTVSCELKPEESEKAKSLKVGEKVTISGFCNGITKDETMMFPPDVALSKCTVLKK